MGKMKKNILKTVIISVIVSLFSQTDLNACTGICLVAKDGGIVYGRTMEWGTFDLNSRVAIIPRNFSFRGSTPDGLNGRRYKVKYGFVGLDMIGTDFIADGLNEIGLSVGMFYFSGEVEYAKYEKANAENSLTSMDVAGYILSQFASVSEVKEKLNDVVIVAVFEKAPELMWSSTIWTTAWNLTDLTLNYHTQHNRRIRRLELNGIDFGNMGKEIVHLSLDKEKKKVLKILLPDYRMIK